MLRLTQHIIRSQADRVMTILCWAPVIFRLIAVWALTLLRFGVDQAQQAPMTFRQAEAKARSLWGLETAQ